MSKLSDLVLLLPEYELEGYPRHLPSIDADNLLTCWISLWHPQLIAASQAIPRWNHAEQLPSELANKIFVLPQLWADRVSEEKRALLSNSGAILVESQLPWRELQVELLHKLGTTPVEGLVEELRDDFAALGYAYLQIQLMTRQLRYTSNLDQLLFSEQACKAVDATLANDRETAERMLQACFDSLGQERDHYYSLDVNLLDLTLLAKSTLGKSFSQQLSSDSSTTLLASANLLRQVSEKQPASLQRIAELQSDNKLCVIGGLDEERPHPLMPRQSATRDLMRGRNAYKSLGIEPPRVYARMSFGMSAETASMLKRMNYNGALLVALAGGSYPQSSQVKLSWESSDGVFLPALASPVLDASDPSSFVSLGWTVGESLDHQHVPSLIFAHWPDAGCDYFALLKIIARRTPALGKWRLMDEYFVETDQPYHQERLDPYAFKFNWLAEADSAADTVLRTKHTHQLQARGRSLQNLVNLQYQLDQFRNTPDRNHERREDEPPRKFHALSIDKLSPELQEYNDLNDSLFDSDVVVKDAVHLANDLAEKISHSVLERLSKKLGKPKSTIASSEAESRLILNPRSAAIRVPVHTAASLGLDSSADWHFAAGRVGNDHVTSVDVPSMGFVLAPVLEETATDRTRILPLADTVGLLRNEFLEAQIDGDRGHLRSLHIPSRRGNRLSLMIAHRERGSDGKFAYSEMVAQDVKMLTSSNMCGLQRATGRLEKNGAKVGKFEIDYEVWRGSRVLEVTIRLSELQPLTDSNPWKSAYTLRMAWPNEAAILRTFNVGSRVSWPSGRAISPELIEIDETDYHTHYLTGGLAFHRRTEERFLETILACGEQTAVTHRIGIGVDVPTPLLAARSFMDRRHELALSGVATASSGWMASVDVRDVLVDFETPLVDDEGKLVGVRLFVSETSGKSTTAKIRLLRGVESANRVDYFGGMISKLTTEEDRITIALRANEQVNVDVVWKR